MSTIVEIEAAIEALPPEDFDSLAAWMSEKHNARVDATLEQAVQAGKFDAMAECALRAAADGKTIPLHEFVRSA